MEKLTYMPSQGTVSYTSDFNPAIGDTIKVWDAREFIAAATLFIPPQGVRCIRYFGLYSSRSRWKCRSGITSSATPRQGGGRHTVCRAMTRARSHPLALGPNPPAAPPLGRQPFRQKRRETGPA